MKNEVLCKILCHNIMCLVSAFYELGIDADFGRAASMQAQLFPRRFGGDLRLVVGNGVFHCLRWGA
jgi:hypothetical protein